MKPNYKTYLKLFTSTFYISAFTFGGGFVIIPLMRKKFVQELKWIEEQEMIDLTAIAQSSPGAIAVNTSILVGYRTAGLLGAIVTVIGTVLPPLICLSIISLFYTAFRDNNIIKSALKGMQAGVAAVIIDVAYNMGNGIVLEKKKVPLSILIGTFIAVYFFNINVIYIILTCIAIGIILPLWPQRKEHDTHDPF
ncbi:chromate transporter [Cellulosilyticum sp. I15G10I2]|uniref:chromate transporter n=1 Tax=Cellulosilyticum sp. I15G10I2 TaxID=1892843 RepID=UPI00085BB13F|nr:chromate transporter [Cellulosilyticum sp. I15G10I2]